MIDADLKSQLDQINQSLVEIKKKSGTGLWRAFFSGLLNALGYVVGLVIVLVVFGWFLQKLGLWQSFTQEFQTVQNLINRAENLMPPSPTSTPEDNSKSSTGGGPTIVTLPSGQQIEVDLPANLPKGY